MVRGVRFSVECEPLFLDPCEGFRCGENAVCIEAAGTAFCSCKKTFTGNPYTECSPIIPKGKTRSIGDPKKLGY